MPEIPQPALLQCDKPGCKNEGRKYLVDDGNSTTSVILCPTHAHPLTEAIGWGRGVPQTRRPVLTGKGLGRARLDRLIVDDD